MPWQFLDVCDEAGKNLFKEWLYGLVDDERAAVNAHIDICRNQPQLRPPYVDKFTSGECKGLIELRVTNFSVELRPLACYAKGFSVVLLAGAHKQNNRLVPQGACGTALERRRLLEKGVYRRCDHE